MKAKSPDVPFSDFPGPKGELCFWMRHPKHVTFRNMASQEKVVKQQTRAPVRKATAEQLESMMQDAQRGHNEILGGVDSSRGDDVRALLGASSNALRAAGASAFDHDLGLRGTVADLIPDESAMEIAALDDDTNDAAADGDEEDDVEGDISRSATRVKPWKRDENVLRSWRKFVQDCGLRRGGLVLCSLRA